MKIETKETNIWKRKYLKIFTLASIIGTVIGAAGGYLYYVKIGCQSGSCPITSNPYISIIWGAVMGYLLGDMFNPKPKVEVKE
jgi:hypothetical protein